MNKRNNLIYLVPFKQHIPEILLREIPGFDTLSKNINCLSFLDKKLNLGFLDNKII